MEKSMIKTNHIAKCATNLFIEYGIKKVTVEEICKQAGISKGTYYKYFFSNKLDLVIHIVNDIFEESSKGFFLNLLKKVYLLKHY